jgi:hypothetical protein
VCPQSLDNLLWILGFYSTRKCPSRLGPIWGNKKIHESGMVVYACNPSTWSVRQEDLEFEDSLGYIARLPSQTK